MSRHTFASSPGPASISRPVPVLLLCALAILLAACQPAAPNTSPAHGRNSSNTPAPSIAKFRYAEGNALSMSPPATYPAFVVVNFTAATPRHQVVDLVSDLGLRALYPCMGQGLRAGAPWASVNEYPSLPSMPVASLWVNGTAQPAGPPYYTDPHSIDPLAAPDWLVRLAAAPEVREIHVGGWNCPLLGGSATAQFLGPQRTTTYARVTFTGISYEQAVVEISGLGYRLADPCYETASPRPAWRPMGQAASFAATGGLVLAVTEANSTQWQTQTRQLPGFVSLAAPYSAAC